MRSTKPAKTSRSDLLLGQWSRGMGELIEARGRSGFDQVLWQSVRRLVDFDFVMTFAYRDHERPWPLADTLDAPRRQTGTGTAPFARGFERFGKPLSARERQIVTLVLQGHSTESVARHLDISPGTVKIHRKNIYRKLAISTQAELFAAFLGAIA